MTQDSRHQQLKALAAAHGIELTPEQIERAQAALPAGELDDRDLEALAAGKVDGPGFYGPGYGWGGWGGGGWGWGGGVVSVGRVFVAW